MKTFEAVFEYRIKDDHGSRFAHACVRVEAKDDTDAERKISELLQRAVDELATDEDCKKEYLQDPSGKRRFIPTKPLATYRLRAECWSDAVQLVRWICADSVEISRLADGSSVEVTLRNPSHGREVLSINDLKLLIKKEIPDSHVMVETLRTADEYTGERTYGKEAR